MAAVLITQGATVSIATIPKPLTTTSQALALESLKVPSRLSQTSTIKTTIAVNGGIYLYSPSSSYVWQYDSRGKRISEMSFAGQGNVKSVIALSGNVDVVVVVLEGGEDARVMERGKDGKWALINMLKGPGGCITGIASDRDGRLIAIGSDRGKLVVYDHKTGANNSFDVSEHVSAISSDIAFAPTLPSTLVIPSPKSSTLILLDTSTSAIRLVSPFTKDGNTGIRAISFSPIRTIGGEVKGGLCAVLRSGSHEVGLVGLETLNRSAKIVDFGKTLTDVTFLGDAQLAARTVDGTILIKNLRSLEDAAVEIPLGNEPVTGLQYLPIIVRAPRPSMASTVASAVSSRRIAILGENRNASNVPSPTNTSASAKPNGKGKEKESVQVSDILPAVVEQTEKPRKSVRTTEQGTAPTQQRVVSVASPPRPRPSASTSNLRAVSNPTKPSSSLKSLGPRPSSAGAIIAPTPILEESPEDLVEQEDIQPSVNLSWALRAPSTGRAVERDTKQEEKDSEWKMDEMRREIGNLQLDMLRMGRNLKNEIRRAVEPLMTELKDSRDVIERQRREIERLRRGY